MSSIIIIQSHLIDTAAMGKKEKGEALTTGGRKVAANPCWNRYSVIASRPHDCGVLLPVDVDDQFIRIIRSTVR